MNTATSFPVFGLRRRHLLGGALVAGALQSLALRPASADEAPASFLALSAYLTERDQLDTALGARILAAMNALNPGSGAKVDELWQWIQDEGVALKALNDRVKADKPQLAGLAQQVMQGWYQGILGGGTKVRVVAYEHALNAQVVADKLRPPSYAYGGYGSWSANPTQISLTLNTIRR